VLDVASVLAFAPRWVEELAARYSVRGLEALGDQRRHNGRAARPIEVWATDEHRLGLLGLKPIRRRVWAPIGERPVALGHHRCTWLRATAFVQPTGGSEAVWFLSNGLSKPLFEKLPAAFARDTGTGRERHIVLVLDNAGWHGLKSLPAGLTGGAWPCRTGSRWCSCRRMARSFSLPSGCGRWWTSRSPTSTSQPSMTSTPWSPSAAAASTPPPYARIPVSTGGPSRFFRTDQPDFV